MLARLVFYLLLSFCQASLCVPSRHGLLCRFYYDLFSGVHGFCFKYHVANFDKRLQVIPARGVQRLATKGVPILLLYFRFLDQLHVLRGSRELLLIRWNAAAIQRLKLHSFASFLNTIVRELRTNQRFLGVDLAATQKLSRCPVFLVLDLKADVLRLLQIPAEHARLEATNLVACIG